MRATLASLAYFFIISANVAISTPAWADLDNTGGSVTEEPGLIGTWQLLQFENMSADGKVSYPFGEHPSGYFVYDPTGHLSVQVMRNPAPPRFTSSHPSLTELQQAHDAFQAYFGTDRVDQAKHMLHHMIEGSSEPSYTGTEQVRPYKLDGDTLIIDVTDPRNGDRFYRELHRVR